MDVGADFLVRELSLRDVPVVRLNTERIADWQLELNPGSRWRLEGGGHLLSSAECLGVWWRRPEMPEVAGVANPGAREAVHQQWRAFLRGLATVAPERWVSHPSLIARAEDKAVQLKVAAECGLRVPETLWTNSRAEAKAFFEANDGLAVVKSVTSAWWMEEERGWFVFAQLIGADDLPDSKALAAAPVMLQRPIQPKRDLRVTVVGDQALAAKRISTSDDDRLDWRLAGQGKWTPYPLPAAIGGACVELVGAFGLRFSGVDFAIDENGEHWFLEVNPNGEWGWLQHAGLPIAEALADELTQESS